MKTMSRLHEIRGTAVSSQYARIANTLRLRMARDEQHRREMGQRIKELRRAHGYKQQFIADKVGVELRTYQFWQSGDTEPNQEHLEKLAKLFRVSPTFILRGETPDVLTPRQGQLDRIEERLDQLIDLLTETDVEVGVRDALRRLRETVASQSPPAPARSESVREAARRKSA